ncbi:hypothetical protein [Burkholderia sp. Ac-20379]|uniref:hypothetical protein n=1 Tax=Burkholderia sp. Ac-20379 TaxID=2703900 RepID=UPI00197EE4B8|nr:hypothetical protein [Burkholderia sp. Ac-20379]MBN3724076.1 hypothetical protein [Burkholderia sp. Ac-20379]
MSIASIVRRWLVAKLAATTAAGFVARPRGMMPSHARALRWRAPWLPRQLTSWLLSTLLAPPFWIIGTLLLINPDSDQPYFWGAAMAVVPVSIGISIVATNQRHHRAPFYARRNAAAYLFAGAMTLSCGLFALLLWGSRPATELVDLLAATPDSVLEPPPAIWLAALAASFGATASLPACLLHTWLAFDS